MGRLLLRRNRPRAAARGADLGTVGVVEWVPDAPAVVLVTLTVACALLLVEVALPTFGVAGFSALVLGAVGLVVLVEQAHPWWPLALVALAVSLWAAVLLTWLPTRLGQVAAPVAFASGGAAFGVLAGDIATVVTAVVGAMALAAGFRPLLRATDRLLGLPPQLGMEALLDRVAVVERWGAGRGTVRLDGSLWNARSRDLVSVGDEVVVVGTAGMAVDVAQRASSVS